MTKQNASSGGLNRGFKAPNQGCKVKRKNNGYFKLFAKNLFSILLEIKKNFPKPFLTFDF